MNFDLHLYGETPAELLEVLSHLGTMDSNYHTPIPDERHPAQAPAPQPQSEPVAPPDKPKAQTPAKQKKATQKPAAAPAEELAANPTVVDTSASTSKEGAERDTSDPAAVNPSTPEVESHATVGTSGSTPEPDPATLDKIRDLARSLIVHGKRAEVQQIIKSTGAASISKLPPESYTAVWEQLVNLSSEVDDNAAN